MRRFGERSLARRRPLRTFETARGKPDLELMIRETEDEEERDLEVLRVIEEEFGLPLSEPRLVRSFVFSNDEKGIRLITSFLALKGFATRLTAPNAEPIRLPGLGRGEGLVGSTVDMGGQLDTSRRVPTGDRVLRSTPDAPFILVAERTIALESSLLLEHRKLLHDLADRHGSRYVGWEIVLRAC